MAEPVWLETEAILRLHLEQLEEHGGGLGVRDEGLLDSAMSRARNRYVYGETDVVVLATAYASGIVGNHPFIDGNKRTGFIAMALFLEVNGLTVTAEEADVVLTMLALAAGAIDDDAFTAWLRANVAPL
ncbi:MAG: type II toxin-antitoxin system death-on-curing family toxin [Hyphomonadaceae bacterium]|nr:type II toxin-antitoxin system death-on-curing family toxin [Hyphomonadaceae bacterium]